MSASGAKLTGGQRSGALARHRLSEALEPLRISTFVLAITLAGSIGSLRFWHQSMRHVRIVGGRKTTFCREMPSLSSKSRLKFWPVRPACVRPSVRRPRSNPGGDDFLHFLFGDFLGEGRRRGS